MVKISTFDDKEFRKAMNKASKRSKDLSDPFRRITVEWFKGNKAWFTYKSGTSGYHAGADLTDKYKAQKLRKWGFIYPMLKASGKLEESITDPFSKDAVNEILNKKTLLLGTKAVTDKGKPYPFFLHAGTKKMTARPFIVIGPEQVSGAKIDESGKTVNARLKRWTKYLLDHIENE